MSYEVKTQYTRNLVNLWQTAEERRGKYWLARSLGANSYWARRLQDWRISKIERFYDLPEHTPDET